MNELLMYYIDHGDGHYLRRSIVTRYGLTYLRLSRDHVDDLCRWIQKMREQDGLGIIGTLTKHTCSTQYS